MAVRVREGVQDDKSLLPAPEDEIRLIVLIGRLGAEDAARRGIRFLYVSHPPRRPQSLHRLSLLPLMVLSRGRMIQGVAKNNRPAGAPPIGWFSPTGRRRNWRGSPAPWQNAAFLAGGQYD